MKNKYIIFLTTIIMMLLIGCTIEKKDNKEFVNRVEHLINYQKEICANIVGEWYFADFYTPGTGAPSKDRAEDYIDARVEVLYDDNTLMLEFQDEEYEMVYVRPLEQRYFMDTYNYSGGLNSKIINGYAYEISFEKDNESIIIAVDASTHAKITGYYNTTTFRFTDGLSVRDWLAGQSYDFQYEFGLDVLRYFGVIE